MESMARRLCSMASAGCARKRLEPVDVGERAGGRFVREQERDELFQQGIIGVSSSTVAKRKIVLSRAMLTVVMVVSINGKCTAALTA